MELENHQLGIISNGIYSDQIFKLENNNILRFFKKVIVPENIGYSKPAKEIFSYAAKEFETSLSYCIYIGDSYDIDYLGSENAGMKGVLLDRKKNDQNSKCRKIYSLYQLKELLFPV
jgi:putative hydrolase of the HAD superfamily